MMRAKKWIAILMLAAPPLVLAAPKYTIVGNNEKNIAVFDQQKPAAIEVAKSLDKSAAVLSRLMDKGKASPSEIKDMDANIAALEKSASGFVMSKSPFYGCGSAAWSLRRYWTAAIGRTTENLEERLGAYKVDRKQCKNQINERPRPEDIVRAAPDAPAPWRGCLAMLNAAVAQPTYSEWSCPKK